MKDNKKIILNTEKVGYRQLSSGNIQSVHQLFEDNSSFFSLPFDYFLRGTLEDSGFEQNLSLILYNLEIDKPIAAIIVVRRREINVKYCFFKGCVVDKQYRRQGIGSKMLYEFLRRAKEKEITQVIYGPSIPEYWQPGVDIRNTSLYFFFKKHGFKSRKVIFNLTVSLDSFKKEPASKKEGYEYERVQSKDFEETYNFVKHHFPLGTWAEETLISFRLNPPTTFIVKNKQNEIIGWATHSLFFPGSFGPTGVLDSLRGKGIGTELLLWCLWDIKQKGLKVCEIMWVDEHNIKFYSKAIGAYISPIFYPMYKKLK